MSLVINSFRSNIILTTIFLLVTKLSFAQQVKEYRSNGSNYLPTLLCLRADSTFLYMEDFGGRHANNVYIEKGIYKSLNDTLHLKVIKLGVSDQKIKESYTKVALVRKGYIILLREDNSAFLKLKKKNLKKCKCL